MVFRLVGESKRDRRQRQKQMKTIWNTRQKATGLGKWHFCRTCGAGGALSYEQHIPRNPHAFQIKARFVIQYRRFRNLAYFLEVVVVVVTSIIAAVGD
jgi:hypothetical protein